MKVVDLFSGTGAATKAFKDRGHEVITVDINPELKPDIVADVRYLPLRGLKPDFVWASPPCTEFSYLNAKRAQATRQGLFWPEEGMETVAAACDAIASLDPTYWVIENVRGAAKWLGRPTKRVGNKEYKANASYLLWGRFPPIDANVPWKGLGSKYHKRRGQKRTDPPLEDRGRIPYALSLALCLAIERDLL